MILSPLGFNATDKGFIRLSIEAVYSVNVTDFMLYMDIQQAVNLEIFRQFHDEGISYAYPTQTIVLNK